MAWASTHGSGLFTNPWISTLTQVTNQTMNLGTHAFNVALYNNALTPNFSDTLANCAFNAGQWVTTNEVTGTAWATGGVAPGGQAITESPTGTLKWTLTNVSVTGTTISSGAYGCLVYDNQAGLTAKYGLCGIWFGGTGYTTSAGTFAITWPTAGIFNILILP